MRHCHRKKNGTANANILLNWWNRQQKRTKGICLWWRCALRESTKVVERSGLVCSRLNEENALRVQALLTSGPRITTEMIAESFNISAGSFSRSTTGNFEKIEFLCALCAANPDSGAKIIQNFLLQKFHYGADKDPNFEKCWKRIWLFLSGVRSRSNTAMYPLKNFEKEYTHESSRVDIKKENYADNVFWQSGHNLTKI